MIYSHFKVTAWIIRAILCPANLVHHFHVRHFQSTRRSDVRWRWRSTFLSRACLISNTHRRRRRDWTVASAMNAPGVGSRDSFLCCWDIEVGDKWRYNDVIVEEAQKALFVIAPQVDHATPGALRYYGAHQAASHIPALYLPSRSRYSLPTPRGSRVE